MSGNGSTQSDWLSPRGPRSTSGEAAGERRPPLVGSRIHLRREGGTICTPLPLFFFFFFPPLLSSASVRKPSGDQLGFARRPWVSTREYGGWDCTGERGGDGGMPEMVKKKQREAISFHEASERLGPLLLSGGGFLLGKLRPHFIVGG